MRILPFLIFIYSGVVLAAIPFRGPISGAMAGAGRAGMDSAEGAFLNPASITLVPQHELSLYYRDGQPRADTHLTDYGIGIADNSKNSLLAGAVHYVRGREAGFSVEPGDSDYLHLALAKNLLPNFAVGVSGYRLAFAGPGDVSGTQWNFSLGALYMFTPEIGLGYVLDNPAKPGGGTPSELRQETSQGLGFYGSVMDILRFRVDVTRQETHNPEQRLTYMAGLESLANEFLIIRLGFRDEDQYNQNFVTAGLGFNGPRLKANYALEKAVRGASGALHSVDIQIPF